MSESNEKIEDTKTDEELLLEEINAVTYTSDIFNKFKEEYNYVIAIDYTFELSSFTVLWVNSDAKSDFIEFYKSQK